ncbi:Nuclear distribution protein PAC1-2, partial [Clarias magur]
MALFKQTNIRYTRSLELQQTGLHPASQIPLSHEHQTQSHRHTRNNDYDCDYYRFAR